ncbi:MAG: aspartate carbamoyltransferase [Nitrososphaerota archaeon]|nr:aspartate carbamoyltransferase [Nitrososphaerota archaeon]
MSRDAWSGKDVLSILDFSRQDLEQLFAVADDFVERPDSVEKSLSDRIVATAFFEPSTRTRLSFSTAAIKLGAKVIDLSPEASSVMKGESLPDTIRMLESYSDLIVMRHPSEGAALLASEVGRVPIVNGGDGSQHHPSQAMLDLFTIKRLKGRIDGLRYAVLGDVRYARSATSFLYGLSKYSPRVVYLVSPEGLRIKSEVKATLDGFNLETQQVEDIEKVLDKVDVVYMTRIQKERFPDPNEYERVKGSYKITKSTLANAKDAIVMHPLPRTGELAYDVDSLPNAAYMEQARMGVPVRMALLHLVLGDRKR